MQWHSCQEPEHEEQYPRSPHPSHMSLTEDGQGPASWQVKGALPGFELYTRYYAVYILLCQTSFHPTLSL